MKIQLDFVEIIMTTQVNNDRLTAKVITRQSKW